MAPPATFAPPLNDAGCLTAATGVARQLAASPAAVKLARELTTLGNAVRWLRSLPQRNDDGRGAGGPGGNAVCYCNVPQRARGFALDPNCFERSIAFQALAAHLQPDMPVRLASIFVGGNPVHTLPYVPSPRGEWVPVTLDPGSRDAVQPWLEWAPLRRDDDWWKAITGPVSDFVGSIGTLFNKGGDPQQNVGAKDVFTTIHEGGRVVATAFGYGPLAEGADKLFHALGWIN